MDRGATADGARLLVFGVIAGPQRDTAEGAGESSKEFAHCPGRHVAGRGERATVVLEPAVGPVVSVVRSVSARSIEREEISDRDPADADVALEFVRFCYGRRRVAWPALYDEMCAVAARGAFRGMSFGDLVEHGVSFCLSDLPRLVDLTQRVVAEDRSAPELSVAPMTLKAVSA